MARNGNRREPRFDEDDDDDLRAEPRRTSRARAKSQPKRRSGSLIGGLFYWALTLGVWGVIGGGALMVYYGSQLPPIDQL
ncbi:MAG: penicillin-binding protein, partial [Hyphomicrobiales bacterium]